MVEITRDKYTVPIQVPQGAADYVRFARGINVPNLLGDIHCASYSNPDFGKAQIFIGQVQRPGSLREYVAFTDESVLSTLDLMTEITGHHRQWGDSSFTQANQFAAGLKSADFAGLVGQFEQHAYDPHRRMFEINLLASTIGNTVQSRLAVKHLQGDSLPEIEKDKVIEEGPESGLVVTGTGGSGVRINIDNVWEEVTYPSLMHSYRKYGSAYHDVLKTVNWFYPTVRWFADDAGQRVLSVTPTDEELFYSCYAKLLQRRSGFPSGVTGYESDGLSFAPNRFNPLVGLMSIAYMLRRERSLWRSDEEAKLLHDKPWVAPLFLIKQMPKLGQSDFFTRAEKYYKRWEQFEGQAVAA